MDGTENNSSTVSFTVKELFEDIKRSLELLNVKLDNKADRSELGQLSREVGDIRKQFIELQTAITELESLNNASSHADRAVSEWSRWVIPTLLSLAVLAVGIIQLFKG